MITMLQLIEEHRPEIVALCRRFGVRRLAVFGSAARGTDFDPARSDVDLLVEFEASAGKDLGSYFDLKGALEEYRTASTLDPKDEIYAANVKRLQQPASK